MNKSRMEDGLGGCDGEEGFDSRPLIDLAPDSLADAVDEAERALAQLRTPRVYQRSRSLVAVLIDGTRAVRGVERPNGAPFAHRLTSDALRELLARAARFVAGPGVGEPKPVIPPVPIVKALRDRGMWTLPVLDGIVETPILRPDGTILDVPGYDAATRLLYEPGTSSFPGDSRAALGGGGEGRPRRPL